MGGSSGSGVECHGATVSDGKWSTSAGNFERAKASSRQLVWAAIGVALFLAFMCAVALVATS